MKTKIFVCLLVSIFLAINSQSQSKSEEIERLKKNAEQCAKEADSAKGEAEKQRALAIAAQREADKQRDMALAAQKDANERRYLALAKAVAMESQEVRENQLSALLALQAFNFNKKYAGYEFDRDVYKALISASLRFDSTLIKPIPFSSSVVAIIPLAKTNPILAVESNGKIIRWKNQDDQWQSEPLVTRSGIQVISASINKEENTLALKIKSGKKNFQIEIYDLNDLNNPKAKLDLESDAESIRITPDGKGFYWLANARKNIMFCDLVNTKTVVTSADEIKLIDISNDGKRLAGVGAQGKLYYWDVQNFSSTEFQINNLSELTSLFFAPKGNDVVVGNSLGQLKIITNGTVRRVLQTHQGPINQIIFNHGGYFMATIDRSNRILIWNWRDLNKRPQEIQEKSYVASLSFSPNDDQLISSTHFWPVKMSSFASKLCGFIKQNLTKDEWEQYIEDINQIPYQRTCPNLYANDR
jgi:hypothetical protein